MARAVTVVETVRPEKLACEGVKGEAGRSFRENGGGEGDEAFEDEGVRFAFLRGWGSEMEGAGCVGCAVEVLGAGVA